MASLVLYAYSWEWWPRAGVGQNELSGRLTGMRFEAGTKGSVSCALESIKVVWNAG